MTVETETILLWNDFSRGFLLDQESQLLPLLDIFFVSM